MLVRNVMNKRVITCSKDLSLREASKVMVEMNIGSLLVVENEKPIGIITSTDILKAISNNLDLDKVKVEQIMSTPVITIDPSEDLEKAVEIMVKNNIKRLAVVEGEKIVGIITASDIIAIEPKLINQLAQLMTLKLPGYSGG
ncbi:MAG: CBS domain-containing protein [Candidatus Aenigmarchaeota archaeon ex4484_224]|nr:MAG: CBS domain-containing protein [Candidatus Aenigmarchaeota archaeon ex4484_224]